MRRLLFLPMLASLAALVSVSLLNAHSRPVLVDPPAGAILDAPPEEVRAWFTGELRRDPNWNFLRVTNTAGERVDSGEAELSEDRLSMSVGLQPGLPAGRYLVTWRTFDDNDNAILGDCYAFFVGQAAANAALAEGLRLDGGGDCERIDLNAAEGTPVAGGMPQNGGSDGHGHGGEGEEEADDEDDSGGVPAWTLALAAVAGLVAGGVGVKLAGNRA